MNADDIPITTTITETTVMPSHTHSDSVGVITPAPYLPPGAIPLGKKTMMINGRHPTTWEINQGYYFLEGKAP